MRNLAGGGGGGEKNREGSQPCKREGLKKNRQQKRIRVTRN